MKNKDIITEQSHKGEEGLNQLRTRKLKDIPMQIWMLAMSKDKVILSRYYTIIQTLEYIQRLVQSLCIGFYFVFGGWIGDGPKNPMFGAWCLKLKSRYSGDGLATWKPIRKLKADVWVMDWRRARKADVWWMDGLVTWKTDVWWMD